jgi:ribose 5-phosphate isomerase B
VKWYAGSDHAGYTLKCALINMLRQLGDEVVDLGTDSTDPVDYPDFAEEVACSVVAQKDVMGLLVCGSGIGIAMAANKIRGIRAAVVTDEFTARATRLHNDANIVCLGAGVIGSRVAEAALGVFRDTAFEGGRHQRRVDKLNALGDAR